MHLVYYQKIKNIVVSRFCTIGSKTKHVDFIQIYMETPSIKYYTYNLEKNIDMINSSLIRSNLAFILIFLMSFVLTGQENDRHSNIHTSDIDNFWTAFDSIQNTDNSPQKIALMQRLYVDKGTPGLKAFMQLRNFDAERLVQTIYKYPKFWQSIRPNTYKIYGKRDSIQKYINSFKVLYPTYREANIYFTITAIRSGGTTQDSLVLVGAEIATGNQDTDVSEFPDKRLGNFFKTQKTDNIVPFTIHEYVHTQQTNEGKVLLGQAIYEGACDFITELVLGTKLEHAYLVYGKKHEDELKQNFKKELYSEDFSNWLYNGSSAKAMGDLGYFMGYAICKSFYQNALDPKKAIKDIIELDYANLKAIKEFLKESHYYQ